LRSSPKKPEPEPEPEEAEEAAEPETGSSAFVFADGSKYDGNWMMVKGVQMRHGKGVYTEGAAEDQTYDGEWQEDMMQGRGIFSYTTGAQYEGEFAANKYHGHGTFRFPDGAVYVGSFKDNQMHGKGTYTDAQGVEWTGKFFNGTGPGLSNGSVVAK